MLALPPTIAGISSKYSSGLAPGIQFALELTDQSSLSEMSARDDLPFSRPLNSANLGGPAATTTTETQPPFFPFQRYSTWSSSPSYDPFAGDGGGRVSPSDRADRLRPRLPPEIHGGTRASSTLAGDTLRPFSYAPPSASLISEPGSYQHDVPPPHRPNTDDPSGRRRRPSQDSYVHQTGSPTSQGYTEYELETHSRRGSDMGGAGRSTTARYHTRRRPFNQDEFDGPSQLLPLPLPQQEHARAQPLPTLPVHLDIDEQDEITHHVNDILSRCAYHFVAKYQFPIPLERDKPRVRSPADREWTEWAYLLKRLATKRRIPARVLFENQIKQFVTTLENSIAVRQNNRDQPTRTPKDDRYILQLISAGTQVAKIMMDSLSMEQLDSLYRQTERIILQRRARLGGISLQ